MPSVWFQFGQLGFDIRVPGGTTRRGASRRDTGRTRSRVPQRLYVRTYVSHNIRAVYLENTVHTHVDTYSIRIQILYLHSEIFKDNVKRRRVVKDTKL